MSINSRESANKYYQMVNELVDDYIDKWKIRPSNLKRYLTPGSERFQNFLDRNGLRDVKGADKVLKDVIEDREHMEKDGVMTFESFKFFESDEFKIESLSQCLYKGIEKSNINMEKALADYFDSSLGQIDIIDSGKHLFKIEDWNSENINVIIYSLEDIDIICFNMIEHLYLELSKKKVELTNTISINLSDLIKSNMFREQMDQIFNQNFLIETITSCLGGFEYKGDCGKGENSKYFIWIKNA